MPNPAKVLKTPKLNKYTKFAVFAGIILGVILFGLFSIDLDSLRKPIIKELSKITGLTIEIESLSLSLANGLSLRGSGLKVSYKDNSSRIFSAKKIFLNAKLKPLVKGQLKIKKITLVSPTMNVALKPKTDPIDSSGIFKNIEGLNQGTPEKLENAENSQPTRIPATEVSLFTSLRNLFENQNLSLRIIEVKNAELLLARPKFDLLPAKNIPIGLSARLDLSNPTPNEININGDISNLEIEDLSFKGTLKVNDLLAKEISINANLESAPIAAKQINTIAETLSYPNSIPAKFKSGQIEKIFIDLKGIIDSSENPLKEIVIKSGFKIENIEVSTPKAKKFEGVPFYNIDANGIWENGILNYKVSGMLWGGNIQSNITANLPGLLRGSLTGTYNSETKFDELDFSLIRFNFLDKLTPVTGTANGFIKTQSSLNKDIRTYGKLEIKDLSLKHEIPYTAKQVTFSFAKKSPYQTQARVQFNDLQLNNILLSSVSSKLKISPEKFIFNNGRIIPPNGIILFSGHYRQKSNTYVIRIDGDKLSLPDFLKGKMEGSGLFKGMFQGNFNTAKIIQQKGENVYFSHIADGLSGRFGFEIKNGHINSSLLMTDELIPSLSPVAVISKKIGLRYDTLIGDFKLWKGKTSTDNFELKGPQVNLAASATANLITGELDGEIKVTPIQLLNSLAKAAPLLSDIFKNDLNDALTETHFNLDGTWEKPKLTAKEEKTLFSKPMEIFNK